MDALDDTHQFQLQSEEGEGRGGWSREALTPSAGVPNAHDLSLEAVHQAYDRLRGRQLGSAVFVSDLATELQIGVQKLHEWIRSEVIESGHGSLDDGHWPTATEAQRAAAIEYLGSKRLLIRFSQPDRAALIKEYDSQVKTPEDRKRLERTAPILVAARDKAVVELKREKLAAESSGPAQNPAEQSHRPSMNREQDDGTDNDIGG